MPQLMPLSWILSSFILFIILLIAVSVYSMSYLSIFKLNIMEDKIFMNWCW